MKRKRELAIPVAALIAISALVGVALTVWPDGREQSLEDRIDQAARHCLRSSWWESVGGTDMPFNWSIPELEEYRVRRVWERGIAKGACLLAISPGGQVIELPTEFGQLLRSAGLLVTSEELALDVASTYVTLAAPEGKVVILTNLADIPGIDADREKAVVAETISPPVVVQVGTEYTLNIYTWEEVGGVVWKWKIVLSDDGRIFSERTVVGRWVGAATGLA